jgi:dihydrofolate synthase / folylpolyglutamate synthase
VNYMPPVTPDAGKHDTADMARENRFALEIMGAEIMVDFPLQGRHQLRNLALAIAAAEQLNQSGLRIRPEHIQHGIRDTRWPGRFQIVPAEGGWPEAVLDVAHNPAGAWALRSALSTYYEDRPLTLIFGAMKDKAIREIAEILFPLAEHVVATHAESPRAAGTQEIAHIAAHTGAEILQEQTVSAALARAAKYAGTSGVVVVTGSIYIVGEALAELTRATLRQGV